MEFKKTYRQWIENDYIDKDTKRELENIKDDEEEIRDRFHQELEFGTAGLRGKIGAGTNRMNKYIISKATQGLADTIKSRGKQAMDRGVAIAYDTRHFSDFFAKTAALVLAANGIKVYLFEDVRPTPELSYAVRRLNTISGIVVTASHNPKDYNGYKVYWEEGSQILSNIADEITSNIKNISDYSKIKTIDEEEAQEKGLLEYIGTEIDNEYIEKVKDLAIREEIDKDIKIVYTPLNGTGNEPVRRVLKERNFNNIIVVPEQENPDPDFTTVGYPNPEDPKAFKYAQELGKKVDADLLIATDPDCDRVSCMVNMDSGEYIALNGNQIGALLINYVLESRKEQGTLPRNGVIIKSIVTGDLGKVIAESYGVKTIETLTGFKNICGKVNEIEKNGEEKFIFGYEESIGYVYGTFVRDKDAVISSMLLAEAAAYYKTKDKTLLDVLMDIYDTHGYYVEDLVNIILEGVEGKNRISRMMEQYGRDYPIDFDGIKVKKVIDFRTGEIKDIEDGSIAQDKRNLKTNGLKFILEDGSWYAIRPSGTEPKLKIYIYGKSDSLPHGRNKLDLIATEVKKRLNSID
ncbi:phospho-sugar mutase [Clostridiisalibacter paucivorans]|uniref:phospho-sugar mutase n=1 Tax=Clostridiisalibacter paucivorans TaxID=408753 RepID=UPI00047CE97B|nr:phospho-sugar mutase [Clostridiisalibacter paucivorans]